MVKCVACKKDINVTDNPSLEALGSLTYGWFCNTKEFEEWAWKTGKFLIRRKQSE